MVGWRDQKYHLVGRKKIKKDRLKTLDRVLKMARIGSKQSR